MTDNKGASLTPIDLNRSLTETTHDRLVDAIATGRLAAGARLNQRDLADQLMVSRQPISHALTRLKASGLAIESGRKGLVVAPVDPARLADLYELRTEIEGLVAARAARAVAAGRAATADLARLADALAIGRAIGEQTPVTACIAADVAFHLALYQLAGSDVITESIQPLWPHFRRAMGNALSLANHRKLSWAGHEAIAAAVLAGDGEGARAAARAHIAVAGKAALAGLAPPA